MNATRTDPQEIIGYWFAASDRLPHGDGRRVVIGETLRVESPLKLCEHGLHGSEHPMDALYYAPGHLLYRCRYSGEILRGGDKLCSTERTALAVIDAKDLLLAFTHQQVLSVAHLWTAPEVVKKYLETGDESLWDAAGRRRNTAWDIARATTTAAASWQISQMTTRSAVAAIVRTPWEVAWEDARDMFLGMVRREFEKQPSMA